MNTEVESISESEKNLYERYINLTLISWISNISKKYIFLSKQKHKKCLFIYE